MTTPKEPRLDEPEPHDWDEGNPFEPDRPQDHACYWEED